MSKRDTTGGRASGMAGFHPFADDEATVTVGGIAIENSKQRVFISGSLDICVDATGLEQARALMAALEAVVAALTARDDLPAKAEAEETKPTKRARNPFA